MPFTSGRTSGSYVRFVNVEARVFDPLSRHKQLIDAQGR